MPDIGAIERRLKGVREIASHPYQIQRIRPWRCVSDLSGIRGSGIGAGRGGIIRSGGAVLE